MNCTLFYNKSDGRYLYKNISPITPKDAQSEKIPIQLLEDTSLVDPTFIFSAPTNVMDANYLFVEDLGRFYYITDKVFSKNKIYVKCHVDVLMSFAKEIDNTKVILERQEMEDKYNLYLNDTQMQIENPNDIRTIDFPVSFNEESEFLLILAGDNVKSDDEEGEG